MKVDIKENNKYFLYLRDDDGSDDNDDGEVIPLEKTYYDAVKEALGILSARFGLEEF